MFPHNNVRGACVVPPSLANSKLAVQALEQEMHVVARPWNSPPITNIFIGCSARRCSYVGNTSSLILDGYDNDVGESELLSDVYLVSELLSGQIRGVSLTGTRFSLLFVHVSSGGIS